MKSDTTNPVVTCNLCGKEEFEFLEEDETPFKVVKCKSCSLVFVHPHPDFAELQEHYDHGYYEEWIDRQKEKRFRMWGKRLKRIEKYRRRGSLLDVGCGEGAFLALARRCGWQISGTELSPYAAKYAGDALGTDIFCGELRDAEFHENSFDVVTMWHVLEHVQNPKEYLTEVHRILRPDGLLIIAIPNVRNLIMQIAYRITKRKRLKLFSKDEKEVHLYHFSPSTIKAYLSKSQFVCLSVSPDFGIVESSKRAVNMISVILYWMTGLKIYNAIEVFAAPKNVDFH